MILPNKQFAVIGNPILHSLSPDLFRYAFSQTKIKGNYFRIRPSSAQRALLLARKIGLSGINTTAPFKEEMVRIVDSCSVASQKIGSVNTLLLKETEVVGHNTDYVAILTCLKDAFKENQNCIVIGAGGAARAAIYAAKQLNAKIKIANRTFEKAQKLAQKFECEGILLKEVASYAAETSVFIVTIPYMEEKWQSEWLLPHLTVVDANYQNSSFTQKAREIGCAVFSGKDWLIRQAVPAFSLFTGKIAEETLFKEAIVKKTPISANVISLIGMMGSGKTTIGKTLSEKLGYDFIDMDAEIEQKTQKSICKIFETEGESFFRKIEREVLQSIIEKSSKVVIATGGGIVTQKENRQILREKSLCMWLYDDLQICVDRCGHEKTRPLLMSGNPCEQAEVLFEQRKDWYSDSCELLLDTHEMMPREVSEILYEEICRIR